LLCGRGLGGGGGKPLARRRRGVGYGGGDMCVRVAFFVFPVFALFCIAKVGKFLYYARVFFIFLSEL
jgi:hypothetical protein